MNDWPRLALVWTIVGPLAAAVIMVLVPWAGRALAQFVGGSVLLTTAALAVHVAERGVLHLPIGGFGPPLGIDLRVDGLAALMLLTTAIATFAVGLYSPSYFRRPDATESPPAQRFWPLLCILWASLNALFCSGDVFNLYITLELVGFAAVILVALAGEPAALAAAMRYLLVSLCGSMLYLMGVALVYGQTGTVDLSLLVARLSAGGPATAALVLMSSGLVMKAALFPMHFWLPPAHGNAPSPVSALLSALVVKAAFYILLRLWLEALQSAASASAAQVLGLLGAAAIVWGSVQALRQTRLKLLVAYSTVAQLGYLFLVFPLTVDQDSESAAEAYQGVALFFVGHALAKTAMFLVAGNLLRSVGHDRIRDLEGQAQRLPVTSFAFALAGLCLVGLPPSLGFAGKWLLLSAALAQRQWWWAAALVVGGLLTSAYLLRVFVYAFRGATLPVPAEQPALSNRLPAVMDWLPMTLAFLSVAAGLVAHWPAGLVGVGAPR